MQSLWPTFPYRSSAGGFDHGRRGGATREVKDHHIAKKENLKTSFQVWTELVEERSIIKQSST